MRRLLLATMVAIAASSGVQLGCTSGAPAADPGLGVPPPVGFAEIFGGPALDEASSMELTTDGGCIIAGRTASADTGGFDVYLIKADGYCAEQWSVTFGGPEDDEAHSVQQTDDGGYILAGETRSYGAGRSDAYVIKTNDAGEEEWSKTFGGLLDDIAYSVQQTSDGGFIIAGTTQSFGSGDSDFYLVKIDTAGNEEWTKTLGGPNDDEARAGQQTADGGYILAGQTRSYGAGQTDVYLVKTDSQGNEEWFSTFGGGKVDSARSVQQTADGGYIVAGFTMSYGPGSLAAYLIKTSGDGEEEWDAWFGGWATTVAHSVWQTNDGGYVVAGQYLAVERSNIEPDLDAFIIKTGPTLVEEWRKLYGGQKDDRAVSVRQLFYGAYFIAGDTRSWGQGSQVSLMKLRAQS